MYDCWKIYQLLKKKSVWNIFLCIEYEFVYSGVVPTKLASRSLCKLQVENSRTSELRVAQSDIIAGTCVLVEPPNDIVSCHVFRSALSIYDRKWCARDVADEEL